MILVASATSRAATGGAEPPTNVADDGGAGLVQPAPTAITALPSGVSRSQLLARMSVQRATSYGPGFYGRRTACGVRLGRSTQGVAHRTLPCGSLVTFHHRGRFRTVPVIDRGPYARGVAWDLTAATARSLGLSRSGAVRALVWPPGSSSGPS
jgi:peptidoglycan lytic transglycosylase